MTDSLSTIRHLIDGADQLAPGQPREIYRSSNGDLWELVRPTAEDRCMVRHTPNLPSGGRPSMMTVEQFLAVNGSGPEHAALRILLPRAGVAAADR